MRRSLASLLSLVAAVPSVFFTALPTMVHAQPAPSHALSLGEVLAAAERAYPVLIATLQRRQTAAADALSAAGGFDLGLRARGQVVALGYYEYNTFDAQLEQPTPLWGTTFFGGWRYGRNDIPLYYGGLATKSGGEFRVGATTPLLRNGPIDRRRASIEQAELGKEVAEGDIELVRLDLARTAAYRYWDWVLAGRRLEIARNLLAIAQTRDEAVKRRSELGDVAAIDRVDNERAIAERRERMVAAGRLLEQTAIALSLFYRDDRGEPIVVSADRLPPALPDPDPQPIGEPIDEAIARRPELRRIRALRQQSEVELKLAKNQVLPALDLSLSGARDVGRGPPSLGQTDLIAGVVLEVPLQRRAAKGRVQAAEATLARIAAEEQMARDRITADVRDAASALRAARQRVELARQQRELAIKLEQAERTRFDLGESTLLFVNLREQASADAALVEAEALASWLRAQADYRAATGGGGTDAGPR